MSAVAMLKNIWKFATSRARLGSIRTRLALIELMSGSGHRRIPSTRFSKLPTATGVLVRSTPRGASSTGLSAEPNIGAQHERNAHVERDGAIGDEGHDQQRHGDARMCCPSGRQEQSDYGLRPELWFGATSAGSGGILIKVSR